MIDLYAENERLDFEAELAALEQEGEAIYRQWNEEEDPLRDARRLWWAIDAAWRDENGAPILEPDWFHVLQPSGAIVSQRTS